MAHALSINHEKVIAYLDSHLAIHSLLLIARKNSKVSANEIYLAAIEIAKKAKLEVIRESLISKSSLENKEKLIEEVKPLAQEQEQKVKVNSEAGFNILASLKKAKEEFLAPRPAGEEQGLLATPKEFTLATVAQQPYGITAKMIESTYEAAMELYKIGRYAETSEMLSFYVELSLNGKKKMMAMWGLLSCLILIEKIEQAFTLLLKLKESIERNTMTLSGTEQLSHRTWYAHWALFVAFHYNTVVVDSLTNQPKSICLGCSHLVDHLVGDASYLHQIIQVTCPHLIPYLSAAAILANKKRQIKELAKIINIEESIQDPISQILVSQNEGDIVLTMELLKKATTFIENDAFLALHLNDFIESIRNLSFDSFIRSHKRVCISEVEKVFNFPNYSAAEEFVTKYLSKSTFPAKLSEKDKEENNKDKEIIIAAAPRPLHEAIQKTTGLLYYRTKLLNEKMEIINQIDDDERD